MKRGGRGLKIKGYYTQILNKHVLKPVTFIFGGGGGDKSKGTYYTRILIGGGGG